MDDMIIQRRSGQPYMTVKALAKELDVTTRTINNYVRGLQYGIEIGRYHPMVLAGDRYNFYAILDWKHYCKHLEDKNMRKHLPPFEPMKIAELCGYGMRWERVEAHYE